MTSAYAPLYVSWVQQHFAEDLPAIGLLIDDRLIGMALIAPPQRRMDNHRKLGLAHAHAADHRLPLHQNAIWNTTMQ